MRQRILREAAAGKSLRAIARGLMLLAFPCRSGRKWSHQTVGAIVRRAHIAVTRCEAAQWSRRPSKMSPEWGVGGRFSDLGVKSVASRRRNFFRSFSTRACERIVWLRGLPSLPLNPQGCSGEYHHPPVAVVSLHAVIRECRVVPARLVRHGAAKVRLSPLLRMHAEFVDSFQSATLQPGECPPSSTATLLRRERYMKARLLVAVGCLCLGAVHLTLPSSAVGDEPGDVFNALVRQMLRDEDAVRVGVFAGYFDFDAPLSGTSQVDVSATVFFQGGPSWDLLGTAELTSLFVSISPTEHIFEYRSDLFPVIVTDSFGVITDGSFSIFVNATEYNSPGPFDDEPVSFGDLLEGPYAPTDKFGPPEGFFEFTPDIASPEEKINFSGLGGPIDVSRIPEPSTIAMWSLFGLIGGFVAWRKRKRA